METVKINLTLNRETREVEVLRRKLGNDKVQLVAVVKMVTTTGTKVHVGSLYMFEKTGEQNYTTRDSHAVFYSGMRGNGHGTPSRMRWIGFND